MAHKLSNEDLEELKNAFEEYDLNKDGSITAEEFKKSLSNIGIAISDQEANDYIKKMDKNNNGMIEWEEFLDAKLKELE